VFYELKSTESNQSPDIRVHSEQLAAESSKNKKPQQINAGAFYKTDLIKN